MVVKTNSASSRMAQGRGKRAYALRNIEAIIDAATRLLAVDPDASVNEIAKAAGVGRVTLYGHFESRTALVREVVERAIHNTNDALSAVELDGDPRAALGWLLEATWHLTHRDPAHEHTYVPLNQQIKPHSRKKGYKPRWR